MSNQDNGRQFQQSKKTGVYHGKDEIDHGEYNGNRLEVLDCSRFFMLGQPVKRQEDRITKQSGANQRKQNLPAWFSLAKFPSALRQGWRRRTIGRWSQWPVQSLTRFYIFHFSSCDYMSLVIDCRICFLTRFQLWQANVRIPESDWLIRMPCAACSRSRTVRRSFSVRVPG